MRRAFAPVAALLLAGTASAGVVELISRAALAGDTAARTSSSSTISEDGRYVAFSSLASNLVTGIPASKDQLDVYLLDRVSGSMQLVSASAGDVGRAGDDRSGWPRPSMSGDGRYVAYGSRAGNLVAGQVDVPGTDDVFLFDRVLGANVLVSHTASSSMTCGNAGSTSPVISGDGRFVVFQSDATDLVPGMGAGAGGSNIFVWERSTGAITLVSHAVSSLTTGGSGFSSEQFVSADGASIVFTSTAPDLTVASIVGGTQVYAWDRATGSVTLVSHAAGTPLLSGDSGSDRPTMSANGRYVAYRSSAKTLVGGQTGTCFQSVFAFDRTTDLTTLVTRKEGFPTTCANAPTDDARMSADGGTIVLQSRATDLVAGFVDRNDLGDDIFLFRRATGAIAVVSLRAGSSTEGANGNSFLPTVSADGRSISFASLSTDLVAGGLDNNGEGDVFVFDRNSGAVQLVTHAAGSPAVAANASSGPAAVSADGGFVVYESLASNLVSNLDDRNQASDVFLFETSSGASSLVSRHAPESPCISADQFSSFEGSTAARRISTDGRFVAFDSLARDLSSGQSDSNSTWDVFLSDSLTRTNTLVSHTAASATEAGNGSAYGYPSVSGDGRFVAFASVANDLVAGITDVTGDADVFLFDRLTGATVHVTRKAGAPLAANGASTGPVLSEDGRFVAFTSVATDLVSGQSDANSASDVFLYDRVAASVTLVSHRAGSTATCANGTSTSPSISRDGGAVVFSSTASDLVAGQMGGSGFATYLFDRGSGIVTLVSHRADEPLRVANGAAGGVVSLDGLWVVLESGATDLVPGQVDSNGLSDVFLFDRSAGTCRLVSHRPGLFTTAGSGASLWATASADGRWVVFASAADDLVRGLSGTMTGANLFLFDRDDGTLRLVTARNGVPTSYSDGEVSWPPSISADGDRIAFLSSASDLVSGQARGGGNAFLYDRLSAESILASGSLGSAASPADGPQASPGLSADGSTVVFMGGATDLVLGDFNRTTDVFAFRTRYTAGASSFNALSPCRVVDTRGPAGPWGAPPLAGNGSRTFNLAGRCGIPADAVAVSTNVTAVIPAADGALAFYPAGFAAGGTSTVSYRAGQTRASNAILGLGAGGATEVDVSSPGPTNLVIDVNGYFK